jgi:hypothetical protein
VSAPKADHTLLIEAGSQHSGAILRVAFMLDRKRITDNVFASGWWLDCAQAHGQQVHEAADCHQGRTRRD